MAAFRSQQHRWARGALQTARKLLPRVFRAPLPWHVKTEAFVHLTANATYPLVLALATLLVPVLCGARALAGVWVLGFHGAVVGAGTLPVALFLFRGQRLAGQRGPRVLVDVAAALVLGCGLSWHLACAVGEGVWCRTGEFVRTPKTGAGAAGPARRAGAPPAAAPLGLGLAGIPELALAAAFALVAAWAAGSGRPGAVPFLVVLCSGLVWVGLATRGGGRGPIVERS